MNAKAAKKNQVKCNNCGHVMTINAWGIPVKRQSGDYMNAIERSREKLKKEMGFGIKEEYESNKRNRPSQRQNKRNKKN